MKLNFSSIAILALGLMCGCAVNKNKDHVENEDSKTLVLYYSQTGTTKAVADEIRNELGADIDSIVPVISYGYDYDATIERWRKEKEDSIKVAIKPLSLNVNDYDTIFLGFPIWGGSYASPVETWLADNKLEGKTIITFATFGSGGIEGATSSVAAQEPASKVVEGYGVRAARLSKSSAEINRWLIEKGYKNGEREKLPEYGPMRDVTPEEEEIFNQACGDYKFPLGKPVAFATRTYKDQTDYKFVVKNQRPNGEESNSTIYVTVVPGEKPEFTRVVR